MLLRSVEQRSRPTVLDDNKDSKGDTADLYRFQNHAIQKAHTHQCNTAPALSGSPPDPAPPLRRTANRPSCAKWAELAALPRGCSGASCSMTPYLRPPQERAVSPPPGRGSTGGTGSAGCAGRSGALRVPSAAIEHASNSSRMLRAIEHTSRYRLGAMTSDKAGAEIKKTVVRLCGRPQPDQLRCSQARSKFFVVGERFVEHLEGPVSGRSCPGWRNWRRK